MNEIIARLDRVTKHYGATRALDALTLQLQRGELLALLGPNGAGKTTAVRLLLGLASPTEGTVDVFGGDPREELFRARTGVMLQVGQVPDTLRVREHIELFSSYYDSPMPLADVLRAARLEHLGERLFRDLSGGEQQRALFALAICGTPDLLILDEPTAGLDVETRRSLWSEIERLRARGTTILLTTHYLAEADALADRIAVIDHGRVIAEGTPVEIKRRTSGRKIRFRSSIDVARIRAIEGVLTLHCSSNVIEILTDRAEDVTREILNMAGDVHDLEIHDTGLEDAFLALTANENRERVA